MWFKEACLFIINSVAMNSHNSNVINRKPNLNLSNPVPDFNVGNNSLALKYKSNAERLFCNYQRFFNFNNELFYHLVYTEHQSVYNHIHQKSLMPLNSDLIFDDLNSKISSFADKIFHSNLQLMKY